MIRIALPERIEGKGGQTVSPGACGQQSNSRSEKCAMGSAVFAGRRRKNYGQGNQWQVTLPAYQAGKDNYYAISAVAYDNKGNASKTCRQRWLLPELV